MPREPKRISDLISELTAVKEAHGDLWVNLADEGLLEDYEDIDVEYIAGNRVVSITFSSSRYEDEDDED